MKDFRIFLIVIFFFLTKNYYVYGAVNESINNGAIEGIVYDNDNNKGLSFANVIIKGTNQGTVADENGHYIIKGIKPGFIVLQVSFVGYETMISDKILVNNSQVVNFNIYLNQDNNLEGVVVKPDFFKKEDSAPLSMQRIDQREIESNPGSNRDISRVIQSFPGVASTPAYRNDIIIRGGGPSESKFYLDEVEIPVLNHFSTQGASGGPVGIINADFIRSVNFYSSSFPAEKYNALSGVLSFKEKDGNMKKMNLQFSLGASESAITFDGPIGKKTNYIFSVRRSYLQLLFSAIGLPFLPTFNDYQLRIKTNFNPKNQLTIISIGSLDRLKLNDDINDPTPSQEYILSYIPINNQWSYTIGGVYKHFTDEGYHMLVLSRNVLHNQLYKYPDNDETQEKTLNYNSDEIENKTRYEFHFRQNDIKYVLSASAEYAEYNNDTYQKTFLYDKLTDLKYDTDLNLFKYGLSASAYKEFLNNKLGFAFGLRLDGNNYNDNTANLFNQFSPRLSVSYDIDKKNRISAAVGRYFQNASYVTLGYRDDSQILINKNSAKYIGLDQYNFGIEHKFSDRIFLSIEGFYKKYFNYPINMTTGSSLANQEVYSSVYGAAIVDFIGDGEASGFEILNRWNYDTFSLLASYTYVRSLFTNLSGKYVASAWDSKHLFTLTASKSLKKDWRIGLKWRYVGGLPYTPYDMDKSSEIDVWNINGGAYLDYDLLNENRLKAFHQLDIRIDKNYYFNKWSLMLYFDVQNAYNSQYKSRDYVIRAKNTDGSYKTSNNGNNYILETYPNTSGTVLPTLGVIIKI